MKNLTLLKLWAVMLIIVVATISGCGGGSAEVAVTDNSVTPTVKKGVVEIKIDFRNQTLAAKTTAETVAKAMSDDFDKISFLRNGVTYVIVHVYMNGAHLFAQMIPVENGIADSKDNFSLPEGYYHLDLSCNNVSGDRYFFGDSEITVIAGQCNKAVIDLRVNYDILVSIAITDMPGNFQKKMNIQTIAFNAMNDTLTNDAEALIDDENGTLHFDAWIQLDNPSTKLWYSIKDDDGITFTQNLDIDIAAVLRSRAEFKQLRFPYVSDVDIDKTINIDFPK